MELRLGTSHAGAFRLLCRYSFGASKESSVGRESDLALDEYTVRAMPLDARKLSFHSRSSRQARTRRSWVCAKSGHEEKRPAERKCLT